MARIKISLAGPSGNVFAILQNAKRALIEEGREREAQELLSKAFEPGRTYQDVLTLVESYVEVDYLNQD